ncbi:MAG: type VI secretion system tip protein VgrG [Burkholderiaceae bacterium]|jgi:type VI secretion system secreted protein VgrG|nr:type VI secretion system tip protein VgrG [Burkholderiaceae bacterium]
MARVIKAYTPLAEDQLLFRSMKGRECLSQLYEFTVDLLSPNESIDMKSLLGKPLTLEIRTINGAPRYLSGQIAKVTMMGREDSSARYCVYQAVVCPWLWYLTRTKDCKIFQNKTVVEILDEVLREYGFPIEKQLLESYRQWEYCVQYQETDFNFVSRLMEHAGIYYFFKHDKNSHTLVLADDMGAHPTLPEYPQIGYISYDKGGNQGRECIDRWQAGDEVRPGAFVVDDFNFKIPKASLLDQSRELREYDHDQYEVYEWLGGYSEVGQGRHFARVRLEEVQAQAELDTGHATVRGMAAGYRFTLKNAPRHEDNREYLIVAVEYNLNEGGYASGADEAEYSFKFSVQPTSLPFRAPRSAHIPRTAGPQTATVVGPKGEEIWIDKYGRVKLQFRWDRYGKSDENSSCWVRVSSAWAGSNFGGVNHPRIGQEVVVDFIGGNPDRPIVTGRVYNNDQMPPWQLPANATQSGVLSRSSQGGAYDNANAIRFEDKKGAEQLWLHAEKDQLTEVEHDEDKWVGNDRRKTIDGNETNVIHKNRTETVDLDETITVHGNRGETVDKNETIAIHQNRTETVDMDEHVTIRQNQQHTVDLNRTRKVGQNESVDIGQNRDKTIGNNETINIGGAKAETIALASAETIGLGKALTIGGAYQTSVGLLMNTTVGLSQSEQIGQSKSTKVGTSYTIDVVDELVITVGKSKLIMKSDGTITLNGHDLFTNMTGEKADRIDGNITMKGAKILEN